jgi:alkylation response protein AidB-like acyl-CoA dehydrogenase
MIHTTALAIDSGRVKASRCRRMASESKKFVTEQCWDVANLAMQVMGDRLYGCVSHRKIVRDLRLSMIWVGTNEIMSLIIQHEHYRERLAEISSGEKRNSELDALNAFAEGEKIYE